MPDATDSEGGAEQAAPQSDTGNNASEHAASAHAVPDVVDLRAELDAAQTALREANERAEAEADRALRAAAEAENARKRAERSIENARKFALERFVEALLPAVDSFEQAAEAASATDAPPVPEAFAEGVRLSLKLLVGAMERHGVAVEDPIGAPFDPSLHEAMSVVENAEVEPDSVTQVFQKGYTLNGRLVRPARVIVARPPAVDARPPVVNAETTSGEAAAEE